MFIVFGQTGEYSDHSDWPVKGFTARERAEAFEFECTKAAKAWKETDTARQNEPGYDWCAAHDAMKTAVPGDPNFRCDYTGTDYYTVEVEVEP